MSMPFRSLTPDQAEQLLARIEAVGGEATTQQLASCLGLSLPYMRPVLGELIDRGVLRRVQALGQDRARYARGVGPVNPALVREALRAPLLQALIPGPAILSALATRLGVSAEEIEATGLALAAEGEVTVSFVGALTVLRRSSTPLPLPSSSRQKLWFESPPALLFKWEEATLPRFIPPTPVHPSVRVEEPLEPAAAVVPWSPPRPPRPYVTLELERELRRLLPPAQRRQPGETARVAAHFGLSVRQVRQALARIPKEGGA
ncbi:hypothetical protein ASF71_19235 [Deinococcus sp. Leaf326]|nr:hypothetical protein ASF71_19235 [Deinococcus sp. Leaf326]